MSNPAINADFANALFAFYAASQLAQAPVAAPARPALTHSQAAIVRCVEAGHTDAAKIGRLVGMTLRQTRAMINGLLFAGALVTRYGRLVVA